MEEPKITLRQAIDKLCTMEQINKKDQFLEENAIFFDCLIESINNMINQCDKSLLIYHIRLKLLEMLRGQIDLLGQDLEKNVTTSFQSYVIKKKNSTHKKSLKKISINIEKVLSVYGEETTFRNHDVRDFVKQVVQHFVEEEMFNTEQSALMNIINETRLKR